MNRILGRIREGLSNLAQYLEPRRLAALPLFTQKAAMVLSLSMMPLQGTAAAADTPVTGSTPLVLDTASVDRMIRLPATLVLATTVVESKAQEQERLEALERAKKATATASFAKAVVLDEQREQNRQLVMRLGEEAFGAAQVPYLLQIVQRESGFNHLAQNSRSTAFGLAQFLDKTWKSYGFEKTSDPETQVRALIAYVAKRYGTPQQAMNHHHQYGWY